MVDGEDLDGMVETRNIRSSRFDEHLKEDIWSDKVKTRKRERKGNVPLWET